MWNWIKFCKIFIVTSKVASLQQLLNCYFFSVGQKPYEALNWFSDGSFDPVIWAVAAALQVVKMLWLSIARQTRHVVIMVSQSTLEYTPLYFGLYTLRHSQAGWFRRWVGTSFKCSLCWGSNGLKAWAYPVSIAMVLTTWNHWKLGQPQIIWGQSSTPNERFDSAGLEIIQSSWLFCLLCCPWKATLEMLKGFQVSESVSVTIAIFQYRFPLWLLEAIRQSPFIVNVSVRAHLIWKYWEDRPLNPGSYPWCQIRWPCQKASWCWSYSAQIMSFTNSWVWWGTVIISLIVPRTQSCGGRSRWFGCGSLDSLKFMNLPWSLCLSATICLWHWLLILWCQWQGPRWDCFLVPLC